MKEVWAGHIDLKPGALFRACLINCLKMNCFKMNCIKRGYLRELHSKSHCI